MLTDWKLNYGPVSKLIDEYMVTKGRGSAGVLKTVTGNPISVTDALAAKIKSLTVDMSPIQDLNGYDHPYPAGGGKNKIPFPYTMGSEITVNGVTATVSSDGTVTLNGTATAQAEFPLIATYMDLPAGTYTLSGLPSGGSTTTFLYNAYAFDENGTKLFDYRIPFSRTVTANNPIKRMYIYIRVAEGYTANNLVVKPQFEEGSTATAYAPYSNICPITGRESVTVTRTGKNLADVIIDGYVPSINNGQLVQASGARTDYIPVLPSETYTLQVSNATWTLYLFYYDESKNFIRYTNGTGGFTATTPSNAKYAMVRIGGNYTIGTDTFQLEKGSTATDYEPYKGQTVTIQLGQTVYGGTIDMTTGTVTVDRAMVDLGTLTWERNASLDLFYTNIANAKYVPFGKGNPCKCSALASAFDLTWYGWSNFPDHAISVGNNYSIGYHNTVGKDSAYTDAASFKAAMQGVQLCYELAEPLTVQLTPQTLALLKGSNTLWTDGDALTLTYKAEST
jgi:hypothetical protein